MTDIPCTKTPGPPHISYLHIQNYRVLQDVELKNLQPITVLLGATGSGKSTILDVFNFLSDCFEYNGLYGAWNERGGAEGVRTQGQKGPVVIEFIYQEGYKHPPITYHLAIEEDARKRPVVAEEWLEWECRATTRPFRFLDYKYGKGKVASGKMLNSQEPQIDMPHVSPELLAIDTLGQLTKYPRIVALRRFILSWHFSFLSLDALRGFPEEGAQKRLTTTGDNLPNVLQFLKKQHPTQLEHIFKILREWVPQLESILIEPTLDGLLSLQIKDKFLKRPIMSRFFSTGILKLLAYLTLLRNPNAPQLVGIEQPESFLYAGLLLDLASEFRTASERLQLFVTTYSPLFLDLFGTAECQFLSRDEEGYTRAVRVSTNRIQAGALVGTPWVEKYLGVPHVNDVP